MESKPAQKDQKFSGKRIAELDGLRGIAILLVLIWHYIAVPLDPQGSAFLSFLKGGLSLTWGGVDLFFVLSGFLICGILLDHINSPRYYKTFYIRRACRILPLYALHISVFALILLTPIGASPRYEYLFGGTIPLWSYYLFFQNFYMAAGTDFTAHWVAQTWSLAIEEQFYLLLPLTIRIAPRRALPYLFVIGIFAAISLRMLHPGMPATVLLPHRADGLLLGALIAWIVRNRSILDSLNMRSVKVLIPLCTMYCLFVIATWQEMLFTPFRFTWMAALFGIMLWCALNFQNGWYGKTLRSSALRWFGVRSYSLYLFHQGIHGFLCLTFLRSEPHLYDLFSTGLTVSALVITCLLAELAYRVIEQPFIAMGQRAHY